MKGLLVLLPVLACVMAGCGAVFVPEVAERPAPPLRTVEVVDAVTGEAVTTAEVRIARVPYAKPLEPQPWATWGEAQSPESALKRLAPGTDPADVPQSRPARHLGDGWFEVRAQPAWTWQQVVWPLAGSEEPVVYHARWPHLVVSAPGYRTVWVADPRTKPDAGRPAVRYEFGPARPPEPGPSVRLTEAGLQVALPPRSLPTLGPQWRWDGPGRPAEAPQADAEAEDEEGVDG